MRIVIEVDVNFTSGKFASKDDVAQALMEEISGLGSLTLDESEYEIADANIAPETFERKKSTKRSAGPRLSVVDRARIEVAEALRAAEAAREQLGL